MRPRRHHTAPAASRNLRRNMQFLRCAASVVAATGKTPLEISYRKQSVVIAGRKTSVSLEETFWKALKESGIGRNMGLSAMVATMRDWRIASLLHRLALPRVLAPKIDAFLVGGSAAPDRLGEHIPHHGVDLAGGKKFPHWRQVLADLLAGHAKAALVRVGKPVVKRHAGRRPPASHHFGELLGRQRSLA